MEASQPKIFGPIDRRRILLAFAVGTIVYAIVVILYANLIPHLGLEVMGLVVRGVRNEPVLGPTPEIGDRVRSIGGREIDSLPVYVNALAYLRDNERSPAEAVPDVEGLATAEGSVARIGAARYVRVEFQPQSAGKPVFSSWFLVRDLPWQTSTVSILWFVMESFIFWLAWVVYRHRPEDDSAALFFLMCIVTVGAYTGGFYWLQIATSPALTFVFAVCAMSLPLVTLHFFLVFPSPKPLLYRHPRPAFLLLYGGPAILEILILWAIGSVVSSFRHGMPVARIDHYLGLLWWLVRIYLGMSVLMFAGCLASLLHSHQTARQQMHKKQVRWILGGAFFAGLFLGYSFWLAWYRPVEFALGGATWPMLASSLVFTCAYAVSIARYRMIYVDEVLQRGVVYLLITFAGSLLYYGLLFLAISYSPRLVSESSHGQVLLVSTVILASLIGLTTLHARVQMVLDRRFHRERHALDRAMRRMDEAVGRLVDRDTVQERTLEVARDTLGAASGAIYIVDPPGEHLRLGHRLGGSDLPPVISPADELWRLLGDESLLQAHPGPLLPGDAVTPMLRRLGIELVLALRLDERLAGILVLGPKKTGIYSASDLEFAAGLAQMATIALQGAETQRTLEDLNEDLRAKIQRVSRQQHLRELRDQPSAPVAAGDQLDVGALRGSGRAVAELIRAVGKIAGSSATVLLRGESGTGKSLLAEVIHNNSPRAKGPFVKVHCAALSPGVLESELFGHVKGAFTGAHKDKVGRFEMADGGTLFLDEIGDVSLDIQTKLLRVLQEMTFEPVGTSESRKVDVRIIAATHQPIEELVRRGRFREDLFYRLNVISLVVPALRERRDDILELAMHFLDRACARSGRTIQGFDDDVVDRLLAHDWPGNIRELENVIERAVVMAGGPVISLEDLPAEMKAAGTRPLRPLAAARTASTMRASPPAGENLAGELEEIERARLLDALAAGGGNKTRAARLLGIPRSTFCSKLKRHGIDADS